MECLLLKAYRKSRLHRLTSEFDPHRTHAPRRKRRVLQCGGAVRQRRLTAELSVANAARAVIIWSTPSLNALTMLKLVFDKHGA